MEKDKEFKIFNEIMNDAFWLGYILEIKRKITDYSQKEILSSFLIFYSSIFAEETIKSNYGGLSGKRDITLEDIENFLEELGNGFTFIKSEYPIKLGNRYNYIDLLLYNIKYRCYVVVELKITELKKEHTGQIMTYMNYIDKNIKAIEENDTVGIIICKQDNKYVIKYCSDDRIIAREYELVWYNRYRFGDD